MNETNGSLMELEVLMSFLLVLIDEVIKNPQIPNMAAKICIIIAGALVGSYQNIKNFKEPLYSQEFGQKHME